MLQPRQALRSSQRLRAQRPEGGQEATGKDKGDGKGGKNRTSYLRDTPGVFNSRNTQDQIDQENRHAKLTQGTSKIDKKDRMKAGQDLGKKRV